MLKKELLQIKEGLKKELSLAVSLDSLAEIEIKYLGRKKGILTKILRSLSGLSPSEQREVGSLANATKKEIAFLLEQKKSELQKDGLKKKLYQEKIDLTLPLEKRKQGNWHPLTKVKKDIEEIFLSMGFLILDGPEVESQYYNFEALNIPYYHPARDMQDTFYLKGERALVLRTHTSPVQVRGLEKYGPPFKALVPGRVFRYEATDASHDNTFYQIEGLMVDKEINLSHFKAVIHEILETVFERKINLRFRPGFFPFVEPGLELDLECSLCQGKGCRLCKGTGWLEFMGAGMIHPHVLKSACVDPQKWQGFAFGFGLTRLVMLKYRIKDIRYMFSQDLKFLSQF